MKKTVCSSLVFASFLQNVAPLCAMNTEELLESSPAAARPHAAPAQGDNLRQIGDADLTPEDKDYVFNLNKAINDPFRDSIKSFVGNIFNFIDMAMSENDQEVRSFLIVALPSSFEEVERSLGFFREMKAKYAGKAESQHIWITASRVYDSFEGNLRALKGKLPKAETFSLGEFEAFCQESLKLIENVLSFHRGLAGFPKTGGGFRLHVFPDYQDSPSDFSTEERYAEGWQALRADFERLNSEFVQNKMMEINPRLREEIERQRIVAEQQAQAIAEEERRRLQAAADVRQREETQRGIEAQQREEAERREAEERVREAEAAVKRAAAQEKERREAERQLEIERARAAEVAAAAQRAAMVVAEKERRKAPLKEAYQGISKTIDEINANARRRTIDSEGIMRFGDNRGGGGNRLLGRIRDLLPGLFALHGLAYQEPVERAVAHKSSVKITQAQDGVIAFFDMLNETKNMDLFRTTASNFVSSAKEGHNGDFEQYLIYNRDAGENFALFYNRFKEGRATEAEVKELSKRIIRFGLADNGHSSRLLHPLLLAKVIWEQKPTLRPRLNDMLVSLFSQAAEQSGRCSNGATGRTNLMLYQLCGLLVDAPLEP